MAFVGVTGVSPEFRRSSLRTRTSSLSSCDCWPGSGPISGSTRTGSGRSCETPARTSYGSTPQRGRSPAQAGGGCCHPRPGEYDVRRIVRSRFAQLSRSKAVLATLVAVVVAAVAGTTVGYAALSKDVTLTLDGQTRQVSAIGDTVGDVLASEGDRRHGQGPGRPRGRRDGHRRLGHRRAVRPARSSCRSTATPRRTGSTPPTSPARWARSAAASTAPTCPTSRSSSIGRTGPHPRGRHPQGRAHQDRRQGPRGSTRSPR